MTQTVVVHRTAIPPEAVSAARYRTGRLSDCCAPQMHTASIGGSDLTKKQPRGCLRRPRAPQGEAKARDGRLRKTAPKFGPCHTKYGSNITQSQMGIPARRLRAQRKPDASQRGVEEKAGLCLIFQAQHEMCEGLVLRDRSIEQPTQSSQCAPLLRIKASARDG